MTPDVLKKIYQRFSDGRAYPIAQLNDALTHDLVGRTETIFELLGNLGNSEQKPKTPDEVLKEMQFNEMISRKFSSPSSDAGFDSFVRKREEHWPDFTPTVTTKRIRSWKQRADALDKITHPGLALQKYTDLDQEIRPIETIVQEAHFQFEMDIDAQIHP